MTFISSQELQFLRRQAEDRDAWAGVDFLYYALETGAVIDPVRKELISSNFSLGVPLRGFFRVRPPSSPTSQRASGDAAGPEHVLELRISQQQLQDHGISPKAKDQVEVQAIRYEVTHIPKDAFVAESPFNTDLVVGLVRLESPSNPDLPEVTSP